MSPNGAEAPATATLWLFRPRRPLHVGTLPTLAAAALDTFHAFLAFLASPAAFMWLLSRLSRLVSIPGPQKLVTLAVPITFDLVARRTLPSL